MKVLIVTILLSLAGLAQAFTEKDIHGVWKLNEFFTSSGGQHLSYCEGVTGTITYMQGFMSVSINCKATVSGTNAEILGGILFYSGPMEVDSQTNEVIHRVRNFSHPSLNRVFKRKIAMKDENHLSLSGKLANGDEVVLTWARIEKFKRDSNPMTGLYELVGSDNEVTGVTEPVPFCNGFYGTILFTPGMHSSVSINCGEKIPGTFEPADQFGRMYFYSADYIVKGTNAIQLPINASVPAHIGAPAIRAMEMHGDLLTLSGINGSKFKAVWRKVRSFKSL
jgi:hypothetical protein